MITAGDPRRLGASVDSDGCNFALYSASATRIELCLFDADGLEIGRHDLPECHANVWHGFVPGVKPGTGYGYRVHGEWAPALGLRSNPAKLLIDPYAKQLRGEFQWHAAVFGHNQKRGDEADHRDSAGFMPKGVVVGDMRAVHHHPLRPWNETIIYETSVRGFTMRHPALSDRERGRFAGLSHAELIDYLRALGITAVELLPVHAYIDEHFLVQKGLRNHWGYNTLNFFSPMPRFGGSDPVSEFRDMVRTLHDANLEVILDVVYNHTAEGDANGPTLSFRGIDNHTYYRLAPEAPGDYINDTGTGNTINADSPVVQDLIVDSLRYWAHEMGVDGFRFDLASILGRHASGFSGRHPLLQRIANDPVLKHSKLIAEPWDIGPGGYQLGAFPPGWSEWNDRFRDTVRKYWRGDDRQTPPLARRLHGSADIFEGSGRGPAASVNFITSHDGFTLHDLVSYSRPHNLANGENNRDGHQHNYADNHGVEGETDDAAVLAIRRCQQLNMLACLLLAQGTPMLLAGDELGHSQQGNNNAYAQDNEISWIDWDNADRSLLESVRKLIALRQQTPLLRQQGYRHGRSVNAAGYKNIEWLAPDGEVLHGIDWHHAQALMMMLCATDNDWPRSIDDAAVLVILNPTRTKASFTLPAIDTDGGWQPAFYSAQTPLPLAVDSVMLEPISLACLRWRPFTPTSAA